MAEPRPDQITSIDVLRRIVGTAAVHIYEMEWLADGTYRCNEFIGAGLESLLGPLPDTVDEEEAWEAAIHPDDRLAYDRFAETLRVGDATELEYRLVGFDGVVRWVWERATPRTEGGRMLVDGIVADITERRRAAEELAEAQRRLAHLAYHDALTDLPNRLLFHEHLEHAVERARRSGTAVGVLFIDLDDFKLVNDSYGHVAGDALLRTVAERLRGAVRAADVVARLGGDEFLVMVTDLEGPDPAGALHRVEVSVRDALEVPVPLPEADVYPSASIGTARFPEDGAGAAELIMQADIAMYRQKQVGRSPSRPAVLSSLDAAEQLATAARLRRALERDELTLHYQPLVAMDTDRVVGAEALIRWQDPDRGLVGPDAFLALAEHVGLMGRISQWVVETACRQGLTWRDAGLDVYVSVNMPAVWPGGMRCVLDSIAATGLSPDRLMIEITESAAMAQPGWVEPVMAELRERGLQVAMDDFGTGHSSLSRLSQMRVSTLKIDRSFIGGVPHDRNASVLVATIVQLARNLGLEPLAEGVESDEQRRFLIEHGCMLGQGHLWSPAVPPERFAAQALRARRAA
jgi:diguanylate cyclase (GGDEF)-like protein/PAS domain S-box-containing protein